MISEIKLLRRKLVTAFKARCDFFPIQLDVFNQLPVTDLIETIKIQSLGCVTVF